MAIRRIVELGDPLLREVSAPVTGDARATLADLRDTLHEFQRTHGFGRGISAVQVGRLDRVIYIEIAGASYSLVNPEFTAQSPEKFTLWDDCFSFPELMVRLERSQRVALRYQDETGAPRTLVAQDAFAELLQHEMDHLDGVLAIDRALPGHSLATRAEWARRYRSAPPLP
jgi:peptide deformylase